MGNPHGILPPMHFTSPGTGTADLQIRLTGRATWTVGRRGPRRRQPPIRFLPALRARLQRQRAASCDTFSFMNETEPGTLRALSGRVRSGDILVAGGSACRVQPTPMAPPGGMKVHLFLTCLSGEEFDEEAGPQIFRPACTAHNVGPGSRRPRLNLSRSRSSPASARLLSGGRHSTGRVPWEHPRHSRSSGRIRIGRRASVTPGRGAPSPLAKGAAS
jgi:hypothetical protein